ncbi:hypothetical protein H7X64_00265, partial [Armatimonadetes bacterium]|nr:hypothetical protein [bacterium]
MQIFWDTNGYSMILENINDIHKEIVNKEKDLSKKIKNFESELKKYKIEINKEIEVQSLISEFNSKSINDKINSENLIGNPARVHYFRHVYAVDRLNGWVRENRN